MKVGFQKFQEFASEKFHKDIVESVKSYVQKHPHCWGRCYHYQNLISKYTDHNVRSVIISDKPGATFEYNVIVEAYFDISWGDEGSCSKNIWLMLHCFGDLEERPFAWHLTSVEKYDFCERKRKELSNGFVPYIRSEDYDGVATDILQRYYSKILNKPSKLDIVSLVKQIGLRVEYRKIRSDKNICGQIYFADCDNTLVGKVTAGTIVVDPYLSFQCGLGCEKFTIVHECVHWVLHRKGFLFQQLLNESLTSIDCAENGSSVMTGNADAWYIMEVQANAIAARLLMPSNSFRIKLEEYVADLRNSGSLSRLDVMPRALELVARFFGVSKSAVKIRAVELGVAEAIGCFEWVDGHYVEPYIATLDVVSKKLTYTIPVLNIATEIVTKPDLQKLVEQGHFVYADGHIVLCDTRYIYKTDKGLRLTEEAKHNMDKCSVAFSVIGGEKSEGDGSSYPWLNKGKAWGQKVVIEYNGGIENILSAPVDDYVEKNEIYSELYSLLGNDSKANLQIVEDYVMKYRCDITEEAGIDPKTFRGWLSGEHTPNKNSFIRFCLALHVPGFITKFLMEKQGFVLCLENKEDVLVNMALEMMYLEDVEHVIEFLDKLGVNL